MMHKSSLSFPRTVLHRLSGVHVSAYRLECVFVYVFVAHVPETHQKFT